MRSPYILVSASLALACTSSPATKVTGGASGGAAATTGGSNATGAGGAASGGAPNAASGGQAQASGGSGGAPALPAGGSGGQASDTGGAAGQAGNAPQPVAICPQGPFSASPLPEPVVEPQVLCSELRFAEGPVWLSGLGALLFSDFEQNANTTFQGDILRYTPGQSCSSYLAGTGTNGLAITKDETLLGASHLTQAIVRFPQGASQGEPLIERYMELPFSSPNDLTVHSNGTIYFSDPAWQLGNRQARLPQAAYYRSAAGTVVEIEQLNRPNGITLSPDEQRLYISIPNAVRVYDLDAQGVPSNGRTFVNTGSDGMVVDCAGNLYLTNGPVLVFDPAGDTLGTIALPQGAQGTTNVAFGGADRQTLFITTSKELLSVRLNIPGFPY